MEWNQVFSVKVWALVIVFVLALIPSLLPLKLRKHLLKSKKFSDKTTSVILSSSLCCGAGVLLGTIFLHILGEAREGIQGLGKEYSFAELVMCLGFFLVYFVEELTLFWVSGNYSNNPKEEDSAQLNQLRRKYSNHNISIPGFGKRNSLKENGLVEIKDHSCNLGNNNGSNQLPITPENKFLELPDETAPKEILDTQKNLAEGAAQISFLRSIIVIGALSLHGALEGLALGLENEIQDIWLLCFALSAHKIFIGFSIGMEMLEEGISKRLYLIHILIFSIASPVGGTIGIILLQNLETNTPNGQIIIAILQGTSAGAILYVVFCEVLERERGKTNGRMIQFFSVLIGFVIIAVLSAISHKHSHANGHINEHELIHGHDHDPIVSPNNTTSHIGLINGEHWHGEYELMSEDSSTLPTSNTTNHLGLVNSEHQHGEYELMSEDPSTLPPSNTTNHLGLVNSEHQHGEYELISEDPSTLPIQQHNPPFRKNKLR